MSKIYRQGDILLIRLPDEDRVEGKPLEKEDGRVILAYGEATGHVHAITDPGALLFAFGEQRQLLLENPAMLSHEEHAPISLPAGRYQVIRQREFIDFEDLGDNVKD
ncbi:MAG: hypothetical protein OEW39_04935 [Deltaproteobacteria bacterium]|nr:hypothetical protein [Deltaproteobacteria bacterium]